MSLRSKTTSKRVVALEKFPEKPRENPGFEYDLGELTGIEDNCPPEVAICPSFKKIRKYLKREQFIYLIRSPKDLQILQEPYKNGFGRLTDKTDYSFVTRYVLCYVGYRQSEYYMHLPYGTIYLYDNKKGQARIKPRRKVLSLLDKGYFGICGSYVGTHTRKEEYVQEIIEVVKKYKRQNHVSP